MRGKSALYGYLYAIGPGRHITAIQEVFSSKNTTNTLHIYPVPANETTIQISDVPDGAPYMIYSITGVKMASGFLSGKTINISQLKQGVYFAVMNNLRGKFVKQ